MPKIKNWKKIKSVPATGKRSDFGHIGMNRDAAKGVFIRWVNTQTGDVLEVVKEKDDYMDEVDSPYMLFGNGINISNHWDVGPFTTKRSAVDEARNIIREHPHGLIYDDGKRPFGPPIANVRKYR